MLFLIITTKSQTAHSYIPRLATQYSSYVLSTQNAWSILIVVNSEPIVIRNCTLIHYVKLTLYFCMIPFDMLGFVQVSCTVVLPVLIICGSLGALGANTLH